ncbi:hypothetical protein [Streptomyces sp. NPDC093071]|uniref:hypothetical protein n=1 Tax=Streptomyces sp. NPDC093071 TaxID=3366022 RepID=UPI00382F0196
MKVPAGYTDIYGYHLGAFIAGQHTAHRRGTPTTDWIAELDVLGMIGDEHEASFEANMTLMPAYGLLSPAAYGRTSPDVSDPGAPCRLHDN